MDSVDCIIYTKEIIDFLSKDGFFNQELNPFMDSEKLYKEILEVSLYNVNLNGDCILNSDQLEECISKVRLDILNETFDDMVSKGILKPSGIDDDGDIVYSLTEDVKNDIENYLKKNK